MRRPRLWHRQPARTIDDLLLKRHRHHTPLGQLLAHSQAREQFTATVRALLPADLADRVDVVNFRAPILRLRVSNASCGTRLRYVLPDLTSKLRNLADFHGLETIKLQVSEQSAASTPPKPPRVLSASGVEALTTLASSLGERPDYRELRDTVLRLSKHSPRSD